MDRLQKAARARVRGVIGLNSGTSVDALDVLLLEVRGSGWSSKIQSLRFRSVPFPPELKKQVHKLLSRMANRTSAKVLLAEEIVKTDVALGRFMGRSARSMARWAIRNSKPCHLVASHGQTVWHSPQSRGYSATLQLGHPHLISGISELPVAADFRQADIAAGGQGAPLTPALDYLLYKDSPDDTVALNLGGIANLSVIPAGGGPGDVTGFDIGPCNLLLDGLCQTLAGLPFDRGGRLSLGGDPREDTVTTILNDPFFHKPPPRSTGREQFDSGFLKRFVKLDGRRRSLNDHLATGVQFISRSVAGALKRYVMSRHQPKRLVISGGGAHNRVLRSALCSECAPLGLKVVPFRERGMTIDSKEAGLFAWLGSEAVCGSRAHLPQVTGARGSQILGVLVP